MKQLLTFTLAIIALCSGIKTSKAQWIAYNSGWPLYAGAVDRCNGVATKSGLMVAATSHNGIRKTTINAAGVPSGSWSSPAGQPSPSGYIPTITSYTSYIYFFVGASAIYRYDGTTFTQVNPTGLAAIPNEGILLQSGTGVNAYLYFIDKENNFIYKRPVLNTTGGWTYITPTAIENIATAGNITCAKMKGTTMYIGTTNGIYQFETGSGLTTAILSGKTCYNLEPIYHYQVLSSDPNKLILALISNGTMGAEFVRIDKLLGFPSFTYPQTSYGSVEKNSAQLCTLLSGSYTNKYFCTNKTNTGGTPTIFNIAKSLDSGATWIQANVSGALPGGSGGGGSTTYSMFNYFGTLTSGTSYIFALNNGFYYLSPLSSMRTLPQAENPVPSVSLFPNPVQHQLQIRFDDAKLFENENNTITAKLFDLSGRLVMSRPISTQNSNIDLSALPAGMYNVELSSPSDVYAKKLIHKL